jgi:four helix bundle protein
MSVKHHNLVGSPRADDLFVDLHKLTHTQFPASEKYELSSQIRPAGYSVPASIVEGTQRRYPRESCAVLSIASASLAEVGYGLHAATRIGYLLPAELAQWESRMIGIAGGF